MFGPFCGRLRQEPKICQLQYSKGLRTHPALYRARQDPVAFSSAALNGVRPSKKSRGVAAAPLAQDSRIFILETLEFEQRKVVLHRKLRLAHLVMNRSVWIALGIFAALLGYMLIGMVACSGGDADATVVADTSGPPLMLVEAERRQAESIAREVVAPGRTEPSRMVRLRAETSGRVAAVPIAEGERVQEGDVLVELRQDDRPERLAQAEASVEQRRLEYEAALRLKERNLQAESGVAEALAALRAAEQALRAAALDLEDTKIRAPFDGVLQDRPVERGDFLNVGDTVALVLELDPLVIRADVTETQVLLLRKGEVAHAQLANGQQLDGVLRFVAPEADADSRTFRIEMLADNPDMRVPAGLSAEVLIETDPVEAYAVSPALIALNDAGQFGLKYVDEDNVVRFQEAELVKSEPDRLWLAGMPSTLRIITQGQGFVAEGERVEVQESASAQVRDEGPLSAGDAGEDVELQDRQALN